MIHEEKEGWLLNHGRFTSRKQKGKRFIIHWTPRFRNDQFIVMGINDNGAVSSLLDTVKDNLFNKCNKDDNPQ